jgi:hypothetical protein
MKPSTLSPENSDAVTSALASLISLRLRIQDERLDDAHIIRLANEAIKASSELETLTAKVAERVFEITADKTAAKLVSAVRVSEEALDSDDGTRRWLGTAHRTSLAAFRKTIFDHDHGKADAIDLFLAQVTLAGAARARGLLGIPVPAHKLRDSRNVRPFVASDYPASDVRVAIVRAAFEADAGSIALLRSRAGTLPDDKIGQITLIVSAIDGDDTIMHQELGALAGKLAIGDRHRITVRTGRRGEVWAQELSSTLRRR